MATQLLSLALAGAVASYAPPVAVAAAAAPSAAAVAPARSQRRALDGYAYLDDLAPYALSYASCLRVRIPNDNDDDAVDGNVNFYAGAYRAQMAVYATFHVCDNNSGGDQCSKCDYDVEYALDAATFLETGLGHWEDYCENCWGSCSNRKLERVPRWLEDNQVDCDSCSNACADYYQNQGGDDGDDEAQYLDCQEAFQDGDGNQLYYGPQCETDSDTGGNTLVVGVFYDDECTIKAKYDAPDFSYAKFGSVTNGCIACSDDAGAETCEALYGDAYHCLNGSDQTGNDEMSVCSAVKKALTVIDYGTVKKRHRARGVVVRVMAGMLTVSVLGGVLFLAFTYYIRHRGERGRPILEEDVMGDVAGGNNEAAAGTAAATGGSLI